MFSSITSYIWANEADQTVPNSTVETQERQTEDEWVLVDVVQNKKPQKTNDNVVPEKPVTTKAVEESWYITPPSCFNATQADTTILATSPLENLLIEHPSMSVYSQAEPIGDIPESEEYTIVLQPELETPVVVPATLVPAPAQQPRLHRRSLRLADRVDLLAKQVQKSVAEHTKSKLKKKALDQTNKTHHRTSNSKRKRKQLDRKQGKHSGVYSNRGC